MDRKKFIKSTALGIAGFSLLNYEKLWSAAHWTPELNDLSKHKIDTAVIKNVNYHWPRFVGKNSRIDVHGQHKKCNVVQIFTDQGASGWGLTGNVKDEMLDTIIGKKLSELIKPGTGISPNVDKAFDFALHDLMGIVLNKPVYKTFGEKGRKETNVYSGMIYIDELNEGSKGIDTIIENCLWDYDYGYRQLKVKIGRSGRWYPPKEGLKKDIEVVKTIYNTFQDKNVEILVDANDMYSLDDAKKFLDGISPVPLFWLEEPFAEEFGKAKKLREWMNKNGYKKTYYADGERRPDIELCMDLLKKNILDVYLIDIHGFGFTNWVNLMPELIEMGALTSPHAWGNMLKTHYITHLSAALGNITTIEGVTCYSDEIDYGLYPVSDGMIRVSDAPGFGMKLLI